MSARAWLALWTVYIVWGSTYLGIELTGETMPPIFAAGLRFFLTGAIMACFVASRKGPRSFRIGRTAFASAVLVGVLLLGANSMLFIAERTVPIGIASLMIASVPLWIVLFRTVSGDRPGRVSLVGVATGFAGIALLVDPGGATPLRGMMLVLGSAAIWATGSFLSSRLPLPPDALVATAIEMLAGGVMLLPLGVLLVGGDSLDPSAWSARSVFGFAYLILIGSLVGYTAYVWLLGNVPISTAATYAYVNPVVAILLGVVVLSETVTWRIVAGAAIVLASVALVIRNEAARVVEPFAE